MALAADGWPRIIDRSKLKRGAVALALGAAIDSRDASEGEAVLTGLTVLLGSKGLEAQALDAEQIAADGGRPLVVLLIEREGKAVTMLATTIAACRSDRAH